MISNPTDRIKTCNNMDELKQLWTQNVESWKNRKDFDAIVEAKDDRKYSFTWHITLHNCMLRYNECSELCDTSTTADDAVRVVDEARTLELQMAELVFRVIDKKWPVDADGLPVMKAYIDWERNPERMVFNLQGE